MIDEQRRSEQYEEQSAGWEDDRADELAMSAEVPAPALSWSGLCDLIESPLHYWAGHVDPNRKKDDPTPAMLFGRAFHCKVFQPEVFTETYCRKFQPPDNCLRTVAEIRAHAASLGNKLKGSRKDELIDQLIEIDPKAQILDLLEQDYDLDHPFQDQISHGDWERLQGASGALRDEPRFHEILEKPGEAEKTITAPYRGIHLKGRLDWETADEIVDLKSISTQHDRPFYESVNKAIFYRKYHLQAYIYSLLSAIAAGDDPPNPQKAKKYIFVFVESEPPHQTRICHFSPREFGEVNMLWENARIQVEAGIDLYKDLLNDFGANERPWRHAAEIDTLSSEEFPQVIFGR